MPRRLSDITHAFERSTEALEDAQDRLTQATETARVRVDCAAKDRHQAYDALYAYLRNHGDEVVIAGDWAYRQERGQIARAKVVWAHHVYVEDPPADIRNDMGSALHPTITPGRLAESHSYRIPPATDQAALNAMATAWGNVSPEEGEPGRWSDPRAGEADDDPSPEMISAFNAGYSQRLAEVAAERGRCEAESEFVAMESQKD